MPAQVDVNGLEILSRSECLELMAGQPVGRIGTSLRSLPAVLPVSFIVDGDSIVFRTGAGTKFYAAIRNAVVAFEVDDFDPEHLTGWSVLIVGQAREITDPAELEAARRLPLESWIPGDLDRYVRVTAAHVSGRRIVPNGRRP